MSTRVVGRLLSVLGLALTSLVLLGAPAQACSCVMTRTADQVDNADQVFSGTVVDTRETGGGRVGTVVLDVEVGRVFKGEVPATMEVATASSSATCGLGDVPIDQDYVFFTSLASNDRPETSLCSGSGPATKRAVKKLQAVAGPGTTPASADTESGSSEGDGAPDQADASTQSAGDDSGSDDSVPVWPFIGGVLVIALAAGTWSARRTT